MFIIFDTETTGLPGNYNAPVSDVNNWPRVVQLAWQLHDTTGQLLSRGNRIIRPEGFSIPFTAAKVHGITTERALAEGLPLADVLNEFSEDYRKASYACGHNIEFDIKCLGAEFFRAFNQNIIEDIAPLDTKEISTDYCAIPGGKGGKFKWPTLTELHQKLFNEPVADAHDAAYDVSATARCFFGLITQRVLQLKEVPDLTKVHYEAPQLEKSNFTPPSDPTPAPALVEPAVDIVVDENVAFTHLHVHSQYSILQATSDVDAIIKKAKEWNSTSIAITDHGNMMGAFEFVNAANKNEIKAIVGCEFNICRNRLDKTNKDDGFQVVLIAKTKNGYHNLSKLSSIAFTEGFYYVPRIDRDILLQYKEEVLVTTGGLFGEIPNLILNVGEEKAEEAFVWWKEHFGDDFYVELNRHGLEEEHVVNQVMLRFCEKYNVKYFAANNTYYTNKNEAEAQDALICVKEGEFVSRPKKYIGKKGREFRYGLPNNEFYLKSPQEMAALFHDLPEAISTTQEIDAKCESYKLQRDVLLPKFDIPAEFEHEEDKADGGKRGENAYLRHLTYEGTKDRYGEITPEIAERLDFELATIERTGYPGYFLIVQDFCREARKQGVSVGPGRGSAAGSAVAYCIGITNVDPIKYDLLFERFLNPERVSMPDIDIDFDDEGRDKVIEYVRNKYSKNAVAQIITYGTMAAKSSIRDAGRVFELPLSDTNDLAKLIPDNSSIAKLLKWDDKKLSEEFNGDDLANAKRLREIANGDSQESKILRMASILEGSVRNTGIHACGVIITPDDITNFVPVATAKDSDMWCTQFDNSVVESAGLLKMDFLGLKTLTLIKDTLRIVKERHNIEVDIEKIPLDDDATYLLFQRGETVGIFQYESPGMQKYMRELKPTVFDDLIAMNALYRPGPLEYIPSFIKRKHGIDPIEYDLPEMEDNLKETYGITVYQEQVMLLSQKLADFSKGDADVLRKAMGKKQKDVLDKMKGKFVEKATAKGHPADKLEKIWTDWEAFASYAFNKSHSTCYAWIGYQTAYLKAHYPSEYMAAVLSNNMSDIKSVTFFMQECKKQHIKVLGPDVNESGALFSVNAKGEIRFGLAAVKGVGENAVESIVQERKSSPFQSIYDFMQRVDAKTGNKKVLENLALSGALDSFNIPRSAYFSNDGKNETFIETLIRYGNSHRENKNSSQVSLFGDFEAQTILEPLPPKVEPWDTMTQLSKEKEVVGMFISGHPLDDYELEIRNFCSDGGLSLLTDLNQVRNRDLQFAGLVRSAEHKVSKAGKPWGSFILEDYNESYEFRLFGDDYLKFKPYLDTSYHLYVEGKVAQRAFGPEPRDYEFKVSRIEMLGDVRDKLTKFLDIAVKVNALSPQLVDELTRLLNNNGGKTQVRFRLIDEGFDLTAPSNNVNKVSVTNELLETLEKLPELEVSIRKN